MAYETKLRKVGGSVMLAIPPALLDTLDLAAGSPVGIAVNAGRLVVVPRERPRYSLDELLAQCAPKARRTRKDNAWVSGRRAGRELI
jgi:antitoxin ChpS